jgi:hypothetical protein
MRGGDGSVLVLVRDKTQVRVQLAHVKAVMAALADAAADLVELLVPGVSCLMCGTWWRRRRRMGQGDEPPNDEAGRGSLRAGRLQSEKRTIRKT